MNRTDTLLRNTIVIALGTSLALVLCNSRSRRKVAKLARILWDGDEAAMILSGKFDGVAATLDKWSKSACRLDGTLASFEADVNELAAAAAAAAGSDANPSVGASVGDPVVIQRCKAARASLQRDLGAMHGELWKAQDVLDAVSVGHDEDARMVRKGLVKHLSAMHSTSEQLQKRFKAARETLTKIAPPTPGAASSGLRGYKVTEDGRKTTYFNNDLDEEAKALIGDIRPKRIIASDDSASDSGSSRSSSSSSSSSPSNAPSGSSSSSSSSSASAWNSAGTWEERDMSSWGRECMTKHLAGKALSSPPLSGTAVVVRVVRVSELTGDCSLTRVRGKVKHLFEWTFTLEWSLDDAAAASAAAAAGSAPIRGSAKFSDVTPDQIEDGGTFDDVAVTVHSKGSGTEKSSDALVRSHIRSSTAGLQPAVVEALRAFARDFNAME